MFLDIYYEKDIRDYTAAEILQHVQEEAAKIDEGLRKEKMAEVIAAIPNLFCWLLSFFNSVGIDAEKSVWEKYQGICPYCGNKENCMCITLDEKPSQWFRNPDGRMPISLDDWQDMFLRIFGRINKLPEVIKVWLHVHEELGELSREVRLGDALNTRHESADCIAWIMSFCNRINVRLAKIAWKTYPGVCSVCKKEKCQCPKV